ncbi:hypothetical protein DENIS_3876 [Desulfonema ishimotonii]|uniref:Teneurin-like YD-shell domain-containing protein n=1 Tax=Desulfonema ishimotonii TaxID=45657 RepID=A0A401G0Y6_9BACT|nr:RHS repeat-associated core domain-containing protein [Desulfonema ishimotonii]GBC62892.1 hypothetical protein DENIS_3876 [Desulfonema ishimotonii]
MIYDQVGTLRAVTDASGNAVKRVGYDTFGNILADSAPLFEVPFGFAGGLHDRDTGLVRFGYRDYDPDTGRWTAKDPILFAGGDTDLYGYCVGDPVNWVDPDGLTAMEWAVPIAIGISQLDTSLPGPADLIAGAIIGAAWLYDNWPDISSWNENSKNDDPCQKERSPYPPAKRKRFKSKKEAYEKAKKAGKGREPKHDPHGEHGPHYHPDVPMPSPEEVTPKRPNPHDHYYYPKGK